MGYWAEYSEGCCLNNEGKVGYPLCWVGGIFAYLGYWNPDVKPLTWQNTPTELYQGFQVV